MKYQMIRIIALLLFVIGPSVSLAQTVSDVDGNVYNTVTIGTQTWMVEDLKTTKFNDGSPIPLVTDYDEWHALETPAYSWYENEVVSENGYGALYNWYAVNSCKLCPDGWHEPSDTDWTILTNNFGTEETAGGNLKETGTNHWQTPNGGATNEAGFTALPGGIRGSSGGYGDRGDFGYWWSSTESNTTEAWYRSIGFLFEDVERLSIGNKHTGFSVRCIMGRAATPIAQETIDKETQELVTIRNEQYGFEVTVPSSWSIRKGIKPDPDEGMRNGSPSFTMDGGDSQGDPKGWNGLATNSPFIAIFANEKTDQNPEEFAKLFESTITKFGGTVNSMNLTFSVGDNTGFYCNYTLGLKSRFVALYKNGIRVIFYTIQFPQNDTAIYAAQDLQIEKVIESLRIK